mmetsp:Transcript_19041/g.57310  ORF Transcript_19041/g.57310 Transcript_19041/m.57310 type:complete len:199 (+) Transcript_19041:285-881(+)
MVLAGGSTSDCASEAASLRRTAGASAGGGTEAGSLPGLSWSSRASRAVDCAAGLVVAGTRAAGSLAAGPVVVPVRTWTSEAEPDAAAGDAVVVFASALVKAVLVPGVPDCNAGLPVEESVVFAPSGAVVAAAGCSVGLVAGAVVAPVSGSSGDVSAEAEAGTEVVPMDGGLSGAAGCPHPVWWGKHVLHTSQVSNTLL